MIACVVMLVLGKGQGMCLKNPYSNLRPSCLFKKGDSPPPPLNGNSHFYHCQVISCTIKLNELLTIYCLRVRRVWRNPKKARCLLWRVCGISLNLSLNYHIKEKNDFHFCKNSLAEFRIDTLRDGKVCGPLRDCMVCDRLWASLRKESKCFRKVDKLHCVLLCNASFKNM